MKPTTDKITKQGIIDQLDWDDRVDAGKVNITVNNGIVELTGTVPGYAEKMAAERDAYQIDGVASVQNKLTIEFPGGKIFNDDEITANIKNKLFSDSRINATNIKVKSTNGIVTLSGVVDTYWEKRLAEDIAYYNLGVLEVVNNLSVSLAKSIEDADIENDIRKAYRRNSVDVKNIDINIKNGVVHLKGSAPDYFTKTQAYDIARLTSGVVNVIDDVILV